MLCTCVTTYLPKTYNVLVRAMIPWINGGRVRSYAVVRPSLVGEAAVVYIGVVGSAISGIDKWAKLRIIFSKTSVSVHNVSVHIFSFCTNWMLCSLAYLQTRRQVPHSVEDPPSESPTLWGHTHCGDTHTHTHTYLFFSENQTIDTPSPHTQASSSIILLTPRSFYANLYLWLSQCSSQQTACPDTTHNS